MSLSLIQSYSSEEEDEEEKFRISFPGEEEDEDEDDDDDHKSSRGRHTQESSFLTNNNPNPSNTRSLLPSAFDAFSEVAGPPEFLNNCVAEHVLPEDKDDRGSSGRPRNRRDSNDLPAGVVMEAKAQLVGIRERVRSDIDGDYKPTPSVPSQKCSNSIVPGEGKRVISATIPDAKDASELLRMCLQCGIPKTFSNARGMVCPVCGDRPPVDADKESDKKKGSTIKDKEKNKRMKGQSSHATWKSETEMQLRQQFD